MLCRLKGTPPIGRRAPLWTAPAAGAALFRTISTTPPPLAQPKRREISGPQPWAKIFAIVCQVRINAFRRHRLNNLCDSRQIPSYGGYSIIMHQRLHDLPIEGFTIIVDGHAKTTFSTKQGAHRAAIELKDRFPTIQVKIYDAEANQAEFAR